MKLIKNLIALFSAIAALFGIFAIVLVLFGYRPFVLLSPSMEPLYREGSLCVINTHTSLDVIATGDVLVYRTSTGLLVLHRLVDITDKTDGILYAQMQGDANNISQAVELSSVNYVGREAFTIPGLGSVVEKMLSLPTLIWGLVGVFVILACIPWSSISKRKAAPV